MKRRVFAVLACLAALPGGCGTSPSNPDDSESDGDSGPPPSFESGSDSASLQEPLAPEELVAAPEEFGVGLSWTHSFGEAEFDVLRRMAGEGELAVVAEVGTQLS